MLKNTCLLFIACLLLLSASVSAQDKEASPKSPENRPVLKTIPIKYADLRSIVNLLYPFNNSIRVDDRMKVLTVFGSASTIEAVEEAVKKLDVPPPPTKNVEITAYFLLAKRESSSGADLPPAVKDVVAELKNVLNYQGFTLLSTALIRTRDGEGSRVSGVAGEGPTAADFGLGIDRLSIDPGEKGPTVHIHSLNFTISSREPRAETKSPDEAKQSHDNFAQIRTDIDIPVGEKVVVGKTAFASAGNALVLVLTAKVMD